MIYTCVREKPRLDAFTDSWSESDRRAFVEVAEEVIAHCITLNGRKRFIRDSREYQYLIDATIASDQPRFIVIVAQKNFSSEQCWNMIDHIRLTKSARQNNASLAEEMRLFDTNPALLKVQAELDETKGIMLGNMERLMDRGENIESIEDTADALLREAGQFERTSRKVKQNEAKKAVLWASWCVVLVIGIFLFVGGGSGIAFFLLRKSK